MKVLSAMGKAKSKLLSKKEIVILHVDRCSLILMAGSSQVLIFASVCVTTGSSEQYLQPNQFSHGF